MDFPRTAETGRLLDVLEDPVRFAAGAPGGAGFMFIVLCTEADLFDVFSCAVTMGFLPAKTLVAAALDDAVASI